ncbi:hypothetical protein LZ30DRAFT_470793 [Colletotrichum cereale]|nr:hypothetical protein LZ30DRAFT_470793 [Colletotrichum cereale]
MQDLSTIHPLGRMLTSMQGPGAWMGTLMASSDEDPEGCSGTSSLKLRKHWDENPLLRRRALPHPGTFQLQARTTEPSTAYWDPTARSANTLDPNHDRETTEVSLPFPTARLRRHSIADCVDQHKSALMSYWARLCLFQSFRITSGLSTRPYDHAIVIADSFVTLLLLFRKPPSNKHNILSTKEKHQCIQASPSFR